MTLPFPRSMYDQKRLNKEIPYTSKGKVDYARLNDWWTPYEVVYEDDAIQLLRFRDGEEVPVLILPPQASHSSQIADYDHGKSIVECALNNTNLPVYCISWKSCTRERSHEDYQDLIEQVLTSIRQTENKKAHLIGLCQGGTLATIVTALHQSNVETLTVAGAPIDVQPTGVLQEAIQKPLSLFTGTVVLLGKGLMTGEMMLRCWMSTDLKRHYWDRFKVPKDYRTHRFDSWYYSHTQNISGTWYLWLVENLFKGNKLIKGEMELRDKKISLTNITCPLNLVTGTRDDISPPEHTNNLGKYVSSEEVGYYEGEAGHVSVFMGGKMLSDVWTKLFKSLEG